MRRPGRGELLRRQLGRRDSRVGWFAFLLLSVRDSRLCLGKRRLAVGDAFRRRSQIFVDRELLQRRIVGRQRQIDRLESSTRRRAPPARRRCSGCSLSGRFSLPRSNTYVGASGFSRRRAAGRP